MKKYDSVLYYVLLTFTTFIFAIISKELLNSNDLLINSLAEQFTQDQIREALNFQQKWQWLGYATPIFLPFTKWLKYVVKPHSCYNTNAFIWSIKKLDSYNSC